MADMGHGSANTQSLSEVMDSRHRPTSETLAIFMGRLMSVKSERDVR